MRRHLKSGRIGCILFLMGNVYSVVRGGFRAAPGFRKSPQDKVLSVREAANLLRAALSEGPPHGTISWCIFAMAVNFGLRSKELISLRRQEDFRTLDSGYFRVLSAKKRGVQEDRIYVDPRHASLIREILQRTSSRSRLLFPFTTRSIRYFFAYYAARAGISPNVSFHALRHTAAKLVLEAASSIRDLAPKAMNIVSAFLRHKPTTTQVYTYPSDEEMLRVMAKKELIR